MAIIEAKSSVAVRGNLDAVVQEFAFPDIHVGAGEDESPWVPFKENVFIRHLSFDVRHNVYANILWVKKGGGSLGKHRHRGKAHDLSHSRCTPPAALSPQRDIVSMERRIATQGARLTSF